MTQKKKKRKKKAGCQPQKISRNHQRNKFLESFRHISSLLDCNDLYEKIPRKEMDMFYMIHFSSIRVEAAPGEKISAKMVRFYNWFFNNWIKEDTIELYKGGPLISLHDCFTIIYTFIEYSEIIERSIAFKVITKIQKVMEKQLDFTKLWLQALSSVESMMPVATLFLSNLLTNLYLFDIRIQKYKVGKTNSSIRILIFKKRCERLSVKFNGKARSVYRLGMPFPAPEFKWIQINAKTLKIPWINSSKALDVYIQAHALKRLYERIDCTYSDLVHSDLLLSLRYPKVFMLKGQKRLIEYRIQNKDKAGYLLAEVVHGVVVIRTFLFLTQEDTPEGERLKKIMGSEREDTKYWALDQLSTFIASDIHKNERLKRKFIEAGCGSLFRINLGRGKVVRGVLEQAEAMVKYFGLDDEEETTVRQNEGTTARKND
ncbi:MAG: hypothetical protein ACQER7_14610 [Bacteroidota bacterium]